MTDKEKVIRFDRIADIVREWQNDDSVSGEDAFKAVKAVVFEEAPRMTRKEWVEYKGS